MIKTSIAISALASLVSLAGFASNLAIANAFGADAGLDCYLAAASIPTIVAGLFGAMLNYSLVPHLVRLRSDPALAGAFARAILVYAVMLSVSLAAIGYGVAEPTAQLLTRTLGAGDGAGTVKLVSTSWLAGAVLILVSLLGCFLYARESYYLVTIASLAPYAGVVLFAMFFRSMGVIAIPLGTLSGALLALGFLAVGGRESLTQGGKPEALGGELREYSLGIPSVIVAMSCFSGYALIDAFWAPRLGPGNLSYLGYAQRILIAAGALVVAGPFATVVQHMAKAESGRKGEFERLLNVVGGTMGIAAAIAALLMVLAAPAVDFLFKRGSFDSSAVQGVSQLLPVMALGAVPMLGSTVLIKGLFQLRIHRYAAIIGGSWCVLYFVLSGMLSDAYGVRGIAFAYTVTWWLVLTAGLWRLLAEMSRPESFRQVAILFVPLLVASASAACAVKVAWGAFDLLSSSVWIRQGLDLVALSACGLGVYAACYAVTRRATLLVGRPASSP